MADFCHEWEPGGPWCGKGPCPDDCLGDFTEKARRWAAVIDPGFYVILGFCEGHGQAVYLYRDKLGDFFFEHGDPNGAAVLSQPWKPKDGGK